MKKSNVERDLEPKQTRRKRLKGLSTGSTLLNLACTGQPNVGFLPGCMYYIVGDSESGKTFLSHTALAEASITNAFKGYDFYYDNAENGALMDIEKYFGPVLAKRLKSPRTKDGSSLFSQTVEEFYYHVDMAMNSEKPFLYVLDSMDALDCEDDEQKFRKKREAFERGKVLEGGGSYGTGKAKINSSGMRRVINGLRDTNSILIVISQTRDDIGGFRPSFMPQQKTRSGGHSLKFYATVEMWSSVKKPIKRKVKGKMRQIGSIISVKIKKNRSQGKKRVVDIPIYTDVGIDDLGGCVNYLIEEGHWKGTEEKVTAPEFQFNGFKDDLIKLIETDNRESELRILTAQIWDDIEDRCKVERKSRYH